MCDLRGSGVVPRLLAQPSTEGREGDITIEVRVEFTTNVTFHGLIMPLEILFVTERRLKRLFNKHYLKGAQTGEYRTRVLYKGKPAAKYKQPQGTISQRVAYENKDGEQIAVCHRYLQPGGKLGASGMPDPKEVRIGDTLYLLETDPRRQWLKLPKKKS